MSEGVDEGQRPVADAATIESSAKVGAAEGVVPSSVGPSPGGSILVEDGRESSGGPAAGFHLPCQPEHPLTSVAGGDEEKASAPAAPNRSSEETQQETSTLPLPTHHNSANSLATGHSSVSQAQSGGNRGSGENPRHIRFAESTSCDVALSNDLSPQGRMISFQSGMTPQGTIGLEIRRVATLEASAPTSPRRQDGSVAAATTTSGVATLSVNAIHGTPSPTASGAEASPNGSLQVPGASGKISVWPSVLGGNQLRDKASVWQSPGSVTLSSQYRVSGLLGEGSFGLVQKAVRLSDSVEVAVKSVALKKMTEVAPDAMQNELMIAKRLKHPYIAMIHAIFSDSEHVHIVMEFCSGGDLFELVAAGHFFSEKRVARYLWQMVSGIAYCHFNSFCHRDIKPENYLVECARPEADIKLIDFGLAKVFKAGEPMFSCVGSVLYIAPEVFKNKGYDEKRDIWSIGIIGHMLCTRRMPFESTTEDEAIEEIRDGLLNFRWLDARLMGESSLKKLIMQLLTLNPLDRPAAKILTRNSWFRNQALEQPSRRCCGFSFDF